MLYGKMDVERYEEIDFRVLCRACALPFDTSVLRDITPPVRDMLLFCVGVEVDLMSELPTHLCGTCYSRADAASQFKLQCQQAEEKIQSLAITKAQLATSTPEHDGSNAVNAAFISPRSNLSDLDVPALTPFTCDMPLEEIFQPEGSTSIVEDNSSISNLVNAILDTEPDNTNPQIALDAEKESTKHIINPDSILSFLNDKDTDSKLSNFDSQESFSLIRNLDTPVNQEDVGVETALDNISKVITTFKEEEAGVEIDVDSIVQVTTTFQAVNDESNNNVIENAFYEFKLEENEEDNDAYERNNEEINTYKELVPYAVDFIKFSMPERKIAEELMTLGHVRCRFCYKEFTEVEIIYEHLTKEHVAECTLCSTSTDYVKLSMPEVKINELIAEKGYVECKLCCKMLTTTVELYKHLKKRHLHVCQSLLKESSNARITEMHEGPLSCKLCKKVFSKQRYLTKHMSKHEKQNEPYKCKICWRNFTRQGAYKMHIKTHNLKFSDVTNRDNLTKTTHLCPLCGAMSSSKANLNTHMKRHNTEPTERCPKCNKSFKMRSELKRHMTSHNKKYQCAICKKSFARSDNLGAHLRIHSGERPYKCERCGSHFVHMKELKRHMLNKRDCGRSQINNLVMSPDPQQICSDDFL